MAPRTPLSRLRAAVERVETRSEPSAAGPPLALGWDGPDAAIGGGLRRGAVHEWLTGDPDPSGGHWWGPPLGVLIHAAGRALREDAAGRRAVWVGRRVWPHPRAVRAAALLERSVFVAPRGDAERLWAIDLALRCAGVAVVVADGSGLGMGESRRLQLAAGAGGGVCLLARPWWERREVSAAWTRWRVAPAPSDWTDPRWTVELLRCKGVRPAPEDARRWAVRREHETGDVRVAADAPDRPGEAAGPATGWAARRRA
ncbi:MAG: hypothetical protein R3B57_10085 [Phycisphaerales bacterium]